jgi:hypothetical protein
MTQLSQVDEEEVAMLINTYDKDNSGEINFDGFLVWYGIGTATWYCNAVLQYGLVRYVTAPL